ncbi:MAG: vWA domain-containing protein [Chthoniobacteraceae bacterium]
MNKDLTEIAFILDRSGSMGSIARDAIAGFNQFLTDQQSAPGQARLTVVLFDDEYQLHVDQVPVAEVLPLDGSTYVPRGSTALLDAIGRTIDNLGKRLGATPEDQRPGKVIVAILTDGQENASHEYSWRAVSRRIRHQTDKYAWEFLFLGANQDAIATCAQLSIAPQNASNWTADGVGAAAGSAALSRKTRVFRSINAGIATPEERACAEAPMEELVQEEDRKRRGE